MKVCNWVIVGICLLLAAHGEASETRERFLKIIDRPRVALAPFIEELPSTNGLSQSRFSFATESGKRVPGILIKPGDDQKRPAVIALHGTGGSKSNMLALCRKLAMEGFVAVAIDAPHHGERSKAGRGSVEYQEAIVRAWRGSGEHPFYYDTVWDVMRLVDYLETRADVDSKRIGLIGISKGGIETYLAAAIDERIAAAVSCIGVQSFEWALRNNAWPARVNTISNAFATVTSEAGVELPDAAFARKFYDRIVPGIYSEFDGPAMLAEIAPRPMLVVNGDSDERTPLAGLAVCTEAAKKAYRSSKAEERFEVLIQKDTGHRVLPESERAAIEWFARWLKP